MSYETKLQFEQSAGRHISDVWHEHLKRSGNYPAALTVFVPAWFGDKQVLFRCFIKAEPGTEIPVVEYPKCRHCGDDAGPWFSRVVPMGNFCQKCGKPWTEQDGVDE